MTSTSLNAKIAWFYMVLIQKILSNTFNPFNPYVLPSNLVNSYWITNISAEFLF